MTAHRLINWTLAAAIAAMMSTAYLLDAPSDVQTRTASRQSAADAQKQAQHQTRFERAAQTMCGGPGSFELLPDNAIQCLSRMGQVTVTAKVAL